MEVSFLPAYSSVKIATTYPHQNPQEQSLCHYAEPETIICTKKKMQDSEPILPQSTGQSSFLLQRIFINLDAGSTASEALTGCRMLTQKKKKIFRGIILSLCNIRDKMYFSQSHSGLVAGQFSNLSICALFVEKSGVFQFPY